MSGEQLSEEQPPDELVATILAREAQRRRQAGAQLVAIEYLAPDAARTKAMRQRVGERRLSN